MPAKLSIHLPDQAVAIRTIPDGADVVLGRDSSAELPLRHASVSRRHAQLTELSPGVWQLRDLNSKNGTRIDGTRIERAQLAHGRWFAIGDVYCEFELIGAFDSLQPSMRAAERRQASAAWTAKLRADTDLQPMLGELLNAIVQVAECQRGFLLSPDANGQFRVVACYALAPDDLGAAAFSGSRSAVDRVISERRPVYLSDRRDRAWLADRASVVAQGIRALVCVPLLSDGELLGIAYADTADEARVFTELDAEVLAALVDRAGSVLAASKLAAQLAQLSAWVAVDASGITRVPGALPMWPTVAGAPR